MSEDWEDSNGQQNGFGDVNMDKGFGRGRGFGGGRGGFGSGSGFSQSNGFGKKIDDDNNNVGGGGFGRGRGFSKPGGDADRSDTAGSFGGGRSNGFGGGESGGFGSNRGGFGSNRGGFGGRGGFGSSNGDDDADDTPRGGGFGSGGRGRGGGGRGGGFGNRGGGSGGGGGCYKCQEDGHMARDCPNSGGGRGGGGGGGCHKCGEEGHFARECPQGGGGGGRSGGGGCHKCGEEGHFARECPQGGGGGGRSGGSGCHKCGEEGHFARECPQGGGGGGGKSGGSGCHKCGEEGHFARECPNQEAGSDKPRESNYVPPEPPSSEEAIFETMQKGINFNKYDEIPVECTGTNAPSRGIQSFQEANLYETFLRNVEKAKYEKPTPVQKWAIPAIMSGRDIMGCAQTGSGKTAAFLLPVLTGMMAHGLEGSKFSEQQCPQAIVVAPTRELVVQIYNEARKFAYGTMLRAVVLYGGTSVQHQLQKVNDGAHIVVATPGRLADFIERGKIGLSGCRYLILDEADRMLDMGFMPAVRKLVEGVGMPPKGDRQTLMFSATFPEEIQRLAAEFLNEYLFITVGRVGGANTDIDQNVFQVTQFDKREKLVEILNVMGSERTLVFVEQKRNADFLASYLSQSDFPTTSIHGDRLQREREEALQDFKTGRAPILVATSVAARGLDIPGVKHVVNYDLPQCIEDYVHRIGRTGRCGNLGKATSFYNPENDKSLARPLVKVLQDAQQEVPDWLEREAESSYGTGGFTGTGGSFGGRDTRKGDTGGSSGGGFSSMGGGGGGDDEEVWD